jgi:tetratricopeptide (TPR) repeat protein
MNVKDTDAAAAAFQKALEQDPEALDAFAKEQVTGWTCCRQEFSASDMYFLCVTTMTCPQSQAEKLRKQGNLAFDQEDYPAAAEAYSNAITIEPTNPAHYLNRATLYFVLQQFEDALTDAEHASFLTPDMWKV